MSRNPAWEHNTVTGRVAKKEEYWDGPVLRCKLDIAYEVDGAPYTHRELVRCVRDDTAPTGPSPFHKEVYLPIMQFDEGDAVELCCNPADPAQCYIKGNEVSEAERAASSIHTRNHRRWYVFLAILFALLLLRWAFSML